MGRWIKNAGARPAWLRTASLISALLVSLSCSDRPPVAPKAAIGAGHARLNIRPSFQQTAAGGPEVPLSLIQGILVGPSGDTVRAEARFVGDSAVLVFDVQITGASQSYTLDLTAFDDHGVVAYHATQQIVAKPGDNSPAPVTQLTYVAPDATLSALHVSPASLSLQANASSALAVTGTASNGQTMTSVRVGWTSKDPSIATVDENGGVRAGDSQGSTYIVARTVVGLGDSALVKVSAPVGAVNVAPATLQIARGQQSGATAELRDAKGHLIDDRTATWASSDPSVATVSASGVIQGVKIGTATITASSEGKSGTVAVSVVSPVDHIELTPASAVLASIGETTTLSARLVARTGASVDGITTSFSSSNAGVASVSSGGAVTAVSNGSATITASADGQTATAAIAVQQKATTIAVSPKTNAIAALGVVTKLTLAASDARGNPIATPAASWTTSNASVATVSASGEVTSVGTGQATITATLDGKTDAAAFTVTQSPRLLYVTPAKTTILVGESTTLIATLADANGTSMGETAATYTSASPTVATVTGSTVTGLSPGTVNITASAAGLTGTGQIRIIPDTTAPPGATLTGQVVSGATAQGISGATVTAPGTSATTSASGAFTLRGVAQGATLTISASGFVSTPYFGALTTNSTSLGIIPLAPVSTLIGNFSGRVIDAVTGLGVPSAHLVARQGINATTNTISTQVTSDANGFYSASLAPGTYTVTGSAAGYIDGTATIVSIGGTTSTNANIVATPIGSGNTIRIVLTWNAEPRDLDSHLIVPLPQGGTAEVAYFNRVVLDQSNNILGQLDQDVTSGFGPETVTIPSVGSGTYTYYVHHFSGLLSMSTAGATVKVFRGSTQIAQFSAPANQGCGGGDIWHVFNLSGTTLTPFNTITCAGAQVNAAARLTGSALMMDQIRRNAAAHPKK